MTGTTIPSIGDVISYFNPWQSSSYAYSIPDFLVLLHIVGSYRSMYNSGNLTSGFLSIASILLVNHSKRTVSIGYPTKVALGSLFNKIMPSFTPVKAPRLCLDNNNMDTMEWPSRSSDLNTMENLWQLSCGFMPITVNLRPSRISNLY
uniref:Ovule protein n=1 Tax=Heterorhabditis bacteriophora TaxID=37862 RepID=A0A1I7WXL1_HETBA